MPRERLRKDPRRPTHTHTHKANPGKKENLISRVITLLNSNAQFSTTTTKIQGIERNRQVCHIQNKSIKTVPKNDLTAEILDKDLKE